MDLAQLFSNFFNVNLNSALRYAKEMDTKDFTALNSSFDQWNNLHDVACEAISREAHSCTLEMAPAWKESIFPMLFSKYTLCDIFNEFALFYKALTNRYIGNLKIVSAANAVKYASLDLWLQVHLERTYPCLRQSCSCHIHVIFPTMYFQKLYALNRPFQCTIKA